MKKLLMAALTISLAISLAGCAVTREGVRVAGGGAGSAESQIDKAREQAVNNARSSVAKEAASQALAADIKTGVIVVGEAGPLRKFSEAERKKFYPEYVKMSEMWHPGKPVSLTEAQFVAMAGGWSTMETFSIPGVFKMTLPAMVHVSDIDTIGFASTVGAFLAGTTGDLVAAESNADGALVITQVLCSDKSPDYRACAKQYAKGRYDINGGRELDRHAKPKEGGVRIDVKTYKLIPAA
jgi:hypothetical protein